MLNNKTIKIGIAAILWTAAIVVAVWGTVNASPRMMHWALFGAILAAGLTEHVSTIAAVRAERVEVDDLIDGLVARAQERVEDESVSRIHRR